MGEREHDGLLVDFGGVLTTNIWESFGAFCDLEGLERDAVRGMFRERGEGLALLRRLERGAISDEEFERDFGAMLGVEPGGLIERLFAGLGPDEAMIAAVEAVRDAGIGTGLISNSWGTGIYERAPMAIFDATVISGDVGLHKPEPEIYRLGAERIGVPIERCVFVDDLRENIEGAEAVGMTGVLHRETEDTIVELEKLLRLPLSQRRPPSFLLGCLAQIASREHGVIDLDTMIDAGIPPSTIRAWARRGHLHRLHDRVYSVIPPALLTQEGRWLAAVKSCGPDAVLSHGSAGQLRGLIPRRARLAIHVSLTTRRRIRPAGIVVHRPRRLDARDVVHRLHIPTTSATRTLFDQAGIASGRELREQFEHADTRPCL